MRTLAASLVLLLVVPACSSVDALLGSGPRPSASLRGVSFGDLSLTSVGLDFNVEVTNPYDVPLPLLNLAYSLASGQQRVLKGAADLQGTIPARKSKVLTLPVELSFADVLDFAQGVRPGAAIPYEADVELSVDAPILGRIPIPLGKRGEIRLPFIPGL